MKDCLVNGLRYFGAVVALSVACSGSVLAQSDIETLVEQMGIETGDVAMRDLPNWHTPRKILVYGGFDIDEDLNGIVPGIQFITATSQADAIAKAADVDAFIGRCSAALVEAAPRATWVQHAGAGVERCMDIERVQDGEMILSNMQKMSSPVIAEHVIAMTLALARNLPQMINVMDSGQWTKGRGQATVGMQSIGGRTMLVVGLGGIGTEVARRAAALDMRVIGTRRSSREGPEFVDYVGLSDELFDLAAEADYIVNALPLTAETTGIFDAKFFAAAKPGAHFINVIITPHVAGNGSNRNRQMLVLRENLRRFVAGDALLNVVDPELGY